MKQFFVLTLFPEMIEQTLSHSIMGRAQKEGHISVEAVNIRDFTLNKHKHVDDYPYGGGAGLVMQGQPIYDAYQSLMPRAEGARVVFMTPQGRPFTQRIAEELAQEENLVFLCGHYEGIDERLIEEIVTDEISLGDFVLTGGELAAITIIDAVPVWCLVYWARKNPLRMKVSLMVFWNIRSIPVLPCSWAGKFQRCF